MATMQNRQQLLCLALLATMSITACGSNKDVIAPPPPGPKQEAPTDGSKVGGGEEQPTNGQLAGGGLPAPDGGTNDGTLPPPIPSTGTSGPTPLPEETKDPEPQPQKTPPSYDSSDYTEVETDNGSKRLTGGTTKDGHVYTSSSTDELLDFLRRRNQRVNWETRQANIRAASAVEYAKIGFDDMSDDAGVTLKIREDGEEKIYNLSGSMVEDYASSSKLRAVRSANGYKTTGTRAIEGTLKCVDLDGGCKNMLARLKIGSSNSAIFYVVFRNSAADLYFKLPGNFSNNREYLTIRDMVFNSILDRNSDNKLNIIRMNSWEVVNGRSGVTLTMKARNNEFLGFAAPLLAPEAGTGVNVRLARLGAEYEENTDLTKDWKNDKLNYANWIGDARLVANNGLGQVRIALKMRKRANYTPEVFTVTFMRKIKPIVELSDENLNLK